MRKSAELRIYEVNGKETGVGEDRTLTLESHWNRSRDLIVIRLDDGKAFTVTVRDLAEAARSVPHGN